MFYFIYIVKSSVTYVWWITSIQWIFEAICLIILSRKNLINEILTYNNAIGNQIVYGLKEDVSK